MPVYLRLWMNGPVADGSSIYIDEVAVVKGRELYSGGPYVAAFPGATPAVVEDAWTLTVTNDRGGALQEWWNRAFAMADNDLLLPTSGTGTNIPDTVIG